MARRGGIPPIRLPKIAMEVKGAGDFANPTLGQGLQAAVERAAFDLAEYARQTWMAHATQMNVRATGAYIRGLQSKASVAMVSSKLKGTSWEVEIDVINTAPHAKWVEEGHAAFRLPERIDWNSMAGRIKRTKTGKPYLHIPFSHAAFATDLKAREQGLTAATRKTMMPASIYAEAKALGRVIPQRQGPIYRPANGLRDPGNRGDFTVGSTSDTPGAENKGRQFVQADTYRQPSKGGRRLDRSHVEPVIILGHGYTGHNEQVVERRSARVVGRDDQGAMLNPAWKSSRFHGLFKSGPGKHTQYMTVRTVTPDSKGWNIPAQAGRFIAAAVASEVRTSPEAARIVTDRIEAAILPRRRTP